MNEQNPITYKEVIDRLKDIKLEDYTKQDTFDRYMAYGTETELNTPEVQRLLIKHNFIEGLITSVDMITDKQAIQDLLASELFKTNNSIIVGEILKIDKAILTSVNNSNVYCSKVTMQDRNSKLYEMKHQVILDIKALDEYIKNLKPYYNNIAAIVTPRGNELLLRCFLQVYEDIDYSTNTI